MLCMDGFSNDVGIGSNGIITWEVIVKGQSAHSGSSFMGVNAVERSVLAMERLMDLKGGAVQRSASLPARR